MSGASGVQYVVMETHYNNERMKSGRFKLLAHHPMVDNQLSVSDYVDSSGLRLFYTPTKRPNDGAAVEIGHVVSVFGWQLLLPPGLDDIVLENVCPGKCTQAVNDFPYVYVLLHYVCLLWYLGNTIWWS